VFFGDETPGDIPNPGAPEELGDLETPLDEACAPWTPMEF